jgi:hypothetical protein
MAAIPVPGYQSFWTEKRQTLKSEYQQLVGQFPDADAQLKQLLKVLCDIENVAGYTSASVGDSEQWSTIVSAAEEIRQNLCKALSGKTLYGMYTVALQEPKAVLKASVKSGPSEPPKSSTTQEDGFKEVRWRKQYSTNEAALILKKAVSAAEITSPKEVGTHNFFTYDHSSD